MEYSDNDRLRVARLDTRELLRLSQTNESGANQGYLFAAIAYDRAMEEGDSIAAGEAAAKAGFRAEQLGKSYEEIRDWFTKSFDALKEHSLQTNRERVATFTLSGRAYHLRMLTHGGLASEYSYSARSNFAAGRNLLGSMHKPHQPWDRYATMHYRQYALFEAMQGSSWQGLLLALDGVRQARHAVNEHPDDPAEHQAFVDKHTKANLVAGAVAVSRVVKFVPSIARWRLQRAQELVG